MKVCKSGLPLPIDRVLQRPWCVYKRAPPLPVAQSTGCVCYSPSPPAPLPVAHVLPEAQSVIVTV